MTQSLSPTIVLRHLKRRFGAVVHSIELSDDEMMDVVFQESRFTFSKFFPYQFNYTLSEKDRIRDSVYRIDVDLEVKNIHKAIPKGGYNEASVYGGYGSGLALNPFSALISADYLSARRTPITFHFDHPNIVTIYPKTISALDMVIQVNAIHPKHLKTVPSGLRDEFLNLATLDVLVSLYPIRHRFENMSTPFGDITPFMNMVDEAENNREQLLDKWQANFLKTGSAHRIFTSN